MELLNFSEKSIEIANAALLLGFDIVEKENYAVSISNRSHIKTVTHLKSASQVYRLPDYSFPELNPTGDDIDNPNYIKNIALTYIVHSKEINAAMMKLEYYKRQDIENVYKPMNEIEENSNIIIFNPETLINARRANFITNFSNTILEKVRLAIVKTRKTNPDIGKNIFIYKKSFSDSGEYVGKFGEESNLCSLWYKHDSDMIETELSQFWKTVWDIQESNE